MGPGQAAQREAGARGMPAAAAAPSITARRLQRTRRPPTHQSSQAPHPLHHYRCRRRCRQRASPHVHAAAVPVPRKWRPPLAPAAAASQRTLQSTSEACPGLAGSSEGMPGWSAAQVTGVKECKHGRVEQQNRKGRPLKAPVERPKPLPCTQSPKSPALLHVDAACLIGPPALAGLRATGKSPIPARHTCSTGSHWLLQAGKGAGPAAKAPRA